MTYLDSINQSRHRTDDDDDDDDDNICLFHEVGSHRLHNSRGLNRAVI